MADKILIRTDAGELVEASTPVIISASRSTDIPAFYAEWLFNRLRRGYVVWYNPFNQRPMYISFQHTKVFVFWTKNPAPILPYLKQLDYLGIHYYFQFTLNDYEKEKFEPGIPSLTQRIETFKKLSVLIGKEKVIWRFDPLILTPNITVRTLLTRIWHIGNAIKDFTNKLVISFVDIKTYRKVQNNLIQETKLFTKENLENAEPRQDQIKEIAEGLMKIRQAWTKEGWTVSIATCAEKINLEKYGIKHNCCIDGELIKQIFPNDKDLIYYLNNGKLPEKTLFEKECYVLQKTINLKDKGQRETCNCINSKDIGMYNTCSHFCVYCYANTSKKVVNKNKKKHNEESESLIP